MAILSIDLATQGNQQALNNLTSGRKLHAGFLPGHLVHVLVPRYQIVPFALGVFQVLLQHAKGLEIYWKGAECGQRPNALLVDCGSRV